MNIIIMGAPGAGKGTQATQISAKLGIPTISTGAIIRSNIKEGTDLGKKAQAYIEAGNLIPDDLVLELAKDRLSKDDCKDGFILDGFPRTIPQAEALDKWDTKIDVALLIDVADDEIIKRLSGRRECSKCAAPYHVEFNPPEVEGKCDLCGAELIHRSDDYPETIKTRLDVFHEQTEPICDFYKEKGLLVAVEGKGKVDDTTAAVMKALGIK